MSANQDWFLERKWGVFTHYLHRDMNNPESYHNQGVGATSWNRCVEDLQTEVLADQLAEIGAHYLFFTMQQADAHLCAPNETFDCITGYKPGEACSERDLILDLHQSLSKRGIALFLYFTGDGPYQDEKAGTAMGLHRVPDGYMPPDFVKNWSSVLQEYTLRYKDKISGWWIDGCYDFFGYTPSLLEYYREAVLAGNPQALLAFNNGVKDRVGPYTSLENYTAGEMNRLQDLPDQRFLQGEQWHTLAPLGILPDGGENGWGERGCKHTPEFIKGYVTEVNHRGGVVTLDLGLHRDGTLCPEQVEILKKAKLS
jgi:hypothetical protein